MIFYYVAAFIVLVLVVLVLAEIVLGSEIKVDNTKKRMLAVTVVIMDCYNNNTGCEVIDLQTNTTEMGNISEPMPYGKDHSKT